MISIRYINLRGAVAIGGKHLGKLRFLAKVPMNFGTIEFNVSFNHIGGRYISGILTEYHGEQKYKELAKGNKLLKGKKIFLVVED